MNMPTTGDRLPTPTSNGSRRSCTIPDCVKPHSAHGLCKNHDQLRRTSERVAGCAVQGCFRKTASPGTDRCQTHHRHRLTDPNKAIKPFRTSSEVRARNTDGFKLCLRCDTWKDEIEYYDASHTSDLKQPECKLCARERNQLRRFKLTPKAYNTLLLRQGSTCAICKEPPTWKRLAIDHDHACCSGNTTCGGCVRGLLCTKCNQMLGFARDETDTLSRAIEYLTDWNSK